MCAGRESLYLWPDQLARGVGYQHAASAEASEPLRGLEPPGRGLLPRAQDPRVGEPRRCDPPGSPRTTGQAHPARRPHRQRSPGGIRAPRPPATHCRSTRDNESMEPGSKRGNRVCSSRQVGGSHPVTLRMLAGIARCQDARRPHGAPPRATQMVGTGYLDRCRHRRTDHWRHRDPGRRGRSGSSSRARR